jgi:hypothetical protein
MSVIERFNAWVMEAEVLSMLEELPAGYRVFCTRVTESVLEALRQANPEPKRVLPPEMPK